MIFLRQTQNGAVFSFEWFCNSWNDGDNRPIIFHFSSGSSFCWLQLLSFIPAAIKPLNRHASFSSDRYRLACGGVFFRSYCLWMNYFTCWVIKSKLKGTTAPEAFCTLFSNYRDIKCRRNYQGHIFMHDTARSKRRLVGVSSGRLATFG